jgi:hypothetical protein
MVIVMNMSSYGFEHNEVEEYGDEILCAGWNPVLDSACQHFASTASSRPLKPLVMPPDLAAADMELFLRNMYAWQQ